MTTRIEPPTHSIELTKLRRLSLTENHHATHSDFEVTALQLEGFLNCAALRSSNLPT